MSGYCALAAGAIALLAALAFAYDQAMVDADAQEIAAAIKGKA